VVNFFFQTTGTISTIHRFLQAVPKGKYSLCQWRGSPSFVSGKKVTLKFISHGFVKPWIAARRTIASATSLSSYTETREGGYRGAQPS
jgi:hypothetical protein